MVESWEKQGAFVTPWQQVSVSPQGFPREKISPAEPIRASARCSQGKYLLPPRGCATETQVRPKEGRGWHARQPMASSREYRQNAALFLDPIALISSDDRPRPAGRESAHRGIGPRLPRRHLDLLGAELAGDQAYPGGMAAAVGARPDRNRRRDAARCRRGDARTEPARAGRAMAAA